MPYLLSKFNKEDGQDLSKKSGKLERRLSKEMVLPMQRRSKLCLSRSSFIGSFCGQLHGKELMNESYFEKQIRELERDVDKEIYFLHLMSLLFWMVDQNKQSESYE